MSRLQAAATDKALRMVAKGSTLASAARKCGLAYTTVWRALQRSGAFYKRRNVKP
jgi:molybdenum-dependent DNA-binding transcriptional regulator ModE